MFEYLIDRIRILHPIFRSYLGSYYPATDKLVFQKKGHLFIVDLKEIKDEWEKTISSNTGNVEENSSTLHKGQETID